MPEASSTARDSRYDVLFEPVQLGPVRARNRFFQVPHCNGMGYRDPTAQAAIDEGVGDAGITRTEAAEVISLLDHLPDVWDLVLGSWELDSATSRFAAEAEREPLIAGLKQPSAKPVVGVGRFTSPDTMVRQLRAGILDMIGAARPSIADPFLPAKIQAGRLDDIRECIGCNICISGDMTMAPIRCTHVDISLQSEITPDDALGHGFTDILVATGPRWRDDGVGRWHTNAKQVDAEAVILTPDDLLTGDHPLQRPGCVARRILVFDDDHY